MYGRTQIQRNREGARTQKIENTERKDRGYAPTQTQIKKDMVAHINSEYTTQKRKYGEAARVLVAKEEHVSFSNPL